MINKPVTDLWFFTELSLYEICQFFDDENPILDAENYWEWAIVDNESGYLNISRTHTKNAAETETRIGPERFSESKIAFIAETLKEQNISPLYCGRWTKNSEGEFDKTVEYTIE